jgi:cell division transport system permease protein
VTLLQALRYFFREAFVNLVRSWKSSLLAVLTIAVSLLLGGAFLLAARNVMASVERWRSEMRVVVYLRPEAPADALGRLSAEAGRSPFVASVNPVSAPAARARFRQVFPGLSDLVEGWQDEPLPASLEIALRDPSVRSPQAQAWLEGWRKRPEVAMVDDDREWLGQLETLVAVGRAAGLALAAALLAGAIFTIASVIRLAAYLHQEEIAILRLIGATEFYIRGPFYAEGLLQGLIGGMAATAGLYGGYQMLAARSGGSLIASLITAGFLSGTQVLFLVLLGGAAGLLGAITSLRREAL